MCIIAAKPAGIAMPSRETIRAMWDGNKDGAGIMYVSDGRVHICKGFMKYKAFAKKLDELEKKLDLTKTPVVMHFRITTHGGTKPENTHPFPITDSIGALKKLVANTDIGVAHNGIISIHPRAGISDTMEYIASQLAPLKRAMPRFFENKHAMTLVENAIESKMAFLTKEGKIYTVGHFIEDGGILYSNGSYMKTTLRFRSTTASCYANWDYDWRDYEDEWEQMNAPFVPDGDAVMMCWLTDADYVIADDGNWYEGLDFLINESGKVFMYDYHSDSAIAMPGYIAFTAEGMPKRFEVDEAEPILALE